MIPRNRPVLLKSFYYYYYYYYYYNVINTQYRDRHSLIKSIE